MSKYYPILFFFLIISSINAQTGCFNSDFSNADFEGWRPSYGPRSNPNLNKGADFGHHFITNVEVVDSVATACGGELFMVPPGEVHAARLGNNRGGTEADRLIYDVDVVTQDNNLFIYKYAVVLQDGGHDKESQPNFSVRILDAQGNEIDPYCGVYNVSSGEPNQNAYTCGDIYWTQWNTIGINLSNYLGKKVSIEFTTRDCSFVQHFGYAYISAKCSKLKVNIAVCSGGNNFTLTAPVGFIGYSWTYKGQVVGTPSQSITLPLADYPAGATFECLLTAFNNGNRCESIIEATLANPTTITPDFSVSIPCKVDYTTFSPITFQDKTSIINGVINKWEWDFGDGKTSTLQNPAHIFENSGDYTVALTAYSDGGCSTFISKPIHIENNPIPRPAIPETQTFCHYPTPTLASLETNGLTVNWYDSLLSTEAISETTKIISNREVYCATIKDGCIGPRTKVQIVLNALGPPIGNSTQSFCSSEAPKISNLQIKGLSVSWYDAQDGGNLLSSNTLLQNNVTYYSSDYDASTGCSSSRWGITVILKEGSAVISPDFTQEFCSNKEELTLKNLNFYSTAVRYYSGINDTQRLSHSTPLENATTYYAAIIDPETKCESNKRTAILVNILPCDVNIYNLITIDDNTSNDHLEIENIEYFPNNSIQIYNRFGQLVYKMSGYGIDENYFYGRANAGEIFKKDEKLPTGSYFYIINYKRRDLTDATKKGFLYIHNNG
jgi:PKD repeat protein